MRVTRCIQSQPLSRTVNLLAVRIVLSGAGAALLVVILSAASVAAQPEVAGIRAGMTLQRARNLLRTYNAKGSIQIGRTQIPELGSESYPAAVLYKIAARQGGDPTELIQLEITLPPEKPLVWAMVHRRLFPHGEQRTSLLARLRQQFGRENYGLTMPIVNLYWAFDERGRRVETGSRYPNCAVPAWDVELRDVANSSASTFPATSPLLGTRLASGGPCKPLVHVKATLQPSGLRGFELIESATITVIDAVLASRAQAATDGYRKTGKAPKARF
jgi:hypothetical protein